MDPKQFSISFSNAVAAARHQGEGMVRDLCEVPVYRRGFWERRFCHVQIGANKSGNVSNFCGNILKIRVSGWK